MTRKQIDPATRRLRHAGVEAARTKVRAAEARAAHAHADGREWDRKIAELIERSRGEAPNAEMLEGLKRERSSAHLLEAQRGEQLAVAREALAKAEASAPTPEQVAAFQAEIQRGLDERLQAARLLTDPAFMARIMEIRRALGEPIGMGSLTSELMHCERHAAEVVRAFGRNTIGQGWWIGGVGDE